MELTTEMLLALWRKFEGQTITIPPCPVIDTNTDIDIDVDVHTLVLKNYRHGLSSEDDHENEYYFIPEDDLKDRIKSVSVGTANYARVGYYQNSEIWYGKPVDGYIIVTLFDGTVYKSAEKWTEPQVGSEVLQLRYWGRHNGNRPHWYSFKPSSQFPKAIRIIVDGCSEFDINYNKTRWEGNGWIVKESEVPGRGLTVVGPVSCESRIAEVRY